MANITKRIVSFIIMFVFLIVMAIMAFATSKSGKSNEIIIEEGFGINCNGEVYGTVANETDGVYLDLVLATGTRGETGYIKNEDLNKTFSTPEEAIAWTQSHQEPYTIPLYEKDGETQIGEFLVTPGTIISD